MSYGKFVEPQVFIIGETRLVEDGWRDALTALGVPEWTTETASDAEALTEFAGKLCYMAFSTDLNKNLTRVGTRTNHDYIQQQLIGQKHGSVLEHCSVTALFFNVSRVLTHEAVRHRPGKAYSQVSGRFVRNDAIDMYLPDDIDASEEATAVFERARMQMVENVKELEKIFDIDKQPFQVKKRLTSAFRRIIGNGQANHIVISGNHRALRHEVAARTAPGAEEEIRLTFYDFFLQLQRRYPAIYADAETVRVEDSLVPQVVFQHEKV